MTLTNYLVLAAILFTIGVQLAPAIALADRPELARRLATALREWTPELIVNRAGSPTWHAQLISWLSALWNSATRTGAAPNR